MTEPRSDRQSAPPSAGHHAEPSSYPVNSVVSIVDVPDRAVAAFHALTGGGFLESEITMTAGDGAADRLHETTGHSGLLGRVLQVANRLGVWDEELEQRHEYEAALRDGGIVITVLAPTEERKQRVARILRENGGRYIHFEGRYTIEELG
jgi:hypothetical protein